MTGVVGVGVTEQTGIASSFPRLTTLVDIKTTVLLDIIIIIPAERTFVQTFTALFSVT